MKNLTRFNRTRIFLDRYKVQTYTVLGVIAALVLIASETYPELQSYLSKTNTVSFITLLIVLDIAITVSANKDQANMQTHSNQDESIIKLLSAASNSKEADLLEYAGSTTLPLIRKLKNENVKVRILVKHPDTITGLQKQRSITTLDTLYNSIFKSYDGKYEIRCYKLPFSLRGRHLHGRLVELGWLTPDYENHTAFGHTNPSIIAEIPRRNNQHFKDFFEKTFNEYWNHTDTEDALEVLNNHKAT